MGIPTRQRLLSKEVLDDGEPLRAPILLEQDPRGEDTVREHEHSLNPVVFGVPVYEIRAKLLARRSGNDLNVVVAGTLTLLDMECDMLLGGGDDSHPVELHNGPAIAVLDDVLVEHLENGVFRPTRQHLVLIDARVDLHAILLLVRASSTKNIDKKHPYKDAH